MLKRPHPALTALALTALALAALLQGCGAARGAEQRTEPMERRTPQEPASPAAIAWRSPLETAHPLVGRIWDVNRGAEIGRDELEAALAEADLVLLGEKHDNEDHHLLQAALLRALVDSGRRPAVAFEMVDADQQAALDGLARPDATADQFAQAVDWAGRWGEFEPYRPIVEVALTAGLPLAAANFPGGPTKVLVRQGLAALSPELVGPLGLDTPLPPAQQASLAEELRQAHCGHPLPEPMLTGMALAQRARDAMMAKRLLEVAGPDGAVLIAGAGHVRKDRGVPAQLERLDQARARSTRAVAFVEVARDEDAPTDYAEHYLASTLPFDFVWFTPVATDVDPCEAFRRRGQQRPEGQDGP